MKDMYPENIDAILISNPMTILGLPLITKHCKFKGKIFASEPTIHFGRLMMRDMVANIKSLPKSNQILDVRSADFLRLNGTAAFASQDLAAWYDFYTENDIETCISRIQKVHFNEPLNLFGLLTVRSVCSGVSIGSCNWLINSKRESIAYISHSSAIVSHVRPLDTQSLSNVDVLIIGTAVQTIVSPIDKLCNELCEKICDTIKSGGNVLIPINVCGFLFDIVERVHVELVRRHLDRTQMFIISSQATSSLAYANIYGEWLSGQKENQLYDADSPFVFEKLISTNKLIACDDISGIFNDKYKSPAIVFASHPSLRMGPAVHLLRLWGSDHLNGLFLVDTNNFQMTNKNGKHSHNIKRMLSPYLPLEMAVHYFPMDSGIKVNELPALIKQLSLPKKAIVLPNEFISNSDIASVIGDIARFPLSTDRFTEIAFNNDESELEEVIVSQTLCDDLKPYVVNDDMSLAMLEAKISQKDGQSHLVPSSTSSSGCLFGTLDPHRLIEELQLKGLTDAKLDVIEEGRRYLVFFAEEDSLIQMNDNSTHVICENEEMRKKIQQALIACFQSM